MINTSDQGQKYGQEFEILTLFPELIEAYSGIGIIARGIANDSFAIRVTNFREFSRDSRGRVDDPPFGGGAGMVIQPGPVVEALEGIESKRGPMHRVLLTPSAPIFNQQIAERLAGEPRLALICGRYEGIDDRVRQFHVDECLSIGDFVLNGGELAALVIIEAVARLRKGVLGNPGSLDQESFQQAGAGALLEYPQFTRPSSFRGKSVPKMLLTGHHENIQQWRQRAACIRTWQERPDLRVVPRIPSDTPIYFAVFSEEQVDISDWMTMFPWVESVYQISDDEERGTKRGSDLECLCRSLRNRHRGKFPVLVQVEPVSSETPENSGFHDPSSLDPVSALVAFDILYLENRITSKNDPLLVVFGRPRFPGSMREGGKDLVDIRMSVPDSTSFRLDNSSTIEESSRPHTRRAMLQIAQNTIEHLREQGILPNCAGADS